MPKPKRKISIRKIARPFAALEAAFVELKKMIKEYNHVPIFPVKSVTICHTSIQPLTSTTSTTPCGTTVVSTTWPAFFSHAYAINLRPERWTKLQQRLGPWAEHVQQWPATDGRQLNPAWLKTQNILAPTSTMTRGQIGCYMSHVNIWKHVIEQNIPAALIIEDDVSLFYSDATQRQRFLEMTQALSQLSDWDLCYLGRGKQIDWPESHLSLPDTFSRPRGCCGLFFYVISQQGARNLLQHVEPIFYPIDLLVARLHDADKIKAISVRERIGYVTSLESDTRNIH